MYTLCTCVVALSLGRWMYRTILLYTGFERNTVRKPVGAKEHRAAERALGSSSDLGREHGSHQDACSLPRSEDDPSTQSGLLCSLSSPEEQLQHCVGGVPLKQAQQTCTFTVMVPNASRSLAVLHAVVTHSDARPVKVPVWSLVPR